MKFRGLGSFVGACLRNTTRATCARRDSDLTHQRIRFWGDCVELQRSPYLCDDADQYRGVANGEIVFSADDMNADWLNGDDVAKTVQQQRKHRRVDAFTTPISPRALEGAVLEGGADLAHFGDPALDVAELGENTRTMRAHSVLARRGMSSVGDGVPWPLTSDPTFTVALFPLRSADRRLIWLVLDSTRL